MLDNEPTNSSDPTAHSTDSTPSDEHGAAPARRRRSPAKKTAAAPVTTADVPETAAPARRRTAKKTSAAPAAAVAPDANSGAADSASHSQAAVPSGRKKPTTATKVAKKSPAKRPARAAAGATAESTAQPGASEPGHPMPAMSAIPTILFQPPSVENAIARPARQRRDAAADDRPTAEGSERADKTQHSERAEHGGESDAGDRDGSGPRRRRRGGRGRRGGGGGGESREIGEVATATTTAPDGASAVVAGDAETSDTESGRPRTRSRGGRGGGSAGAAAAHGEDSPAGGPAAGGAHDDDGDGSPSSRRRRRRRSRVAGEGDLRSPDDPPNTVVRIREPREHDDNVVHGVKGSTRLEAKKQRRREGREQGRHGRRGLVITEAEFLARRESVDRIMVVRQRGDRTQIGVLEDGILVEHFVSTASTNRMVGNVYLGRVQNVLSGMEAAFVDMGKGRNAVLYAGEVNFDTSGLDGQPRRIESALKPGQAVVVQVTKDPIGHKGARLTSQVSLPGRYLVYVPEGSMMGISRKLPDVERSRLKAILKKITPEGGGVIVRTAAEGASEEDLTRDVARLAAQWEDIKKKSETATAPALLYSEPDLTVRVIRDVFNEDFNALIVQADSEWDTVEAYVGHVAPDLVSRLSRWTSEEDIFSHYRIDEQIAKALDRKVWLPSGGYLVIDRTEAMIVIDVNTGRFIGKGGNLEETVTKNNLEAAEEIVRQLRLRDIGGIIVIDFIDMVLEANRDLVLRRLVECLGRDRTKHQVAEVTSLGLVQMTRKRVGNGLLEAFSEVCEVCNGRGVIVHTDLVEQRPPKQLPVPKPTAVRVAKASRARGEAAADTSVEVAASNGDRADLSQPAADADRVEAAAEVDVTDAANGADAADVKPNGSRSRRGGRRRGGSKVAAGSAPEHATVEAG